MSEYIENNVNVGDMMTKATDKVIREFAGKHHGSTIKVIDNIIAFIGGAGGTGTSTIVANVADRLTKKGLTVLVVDMNIMYPIQHSFFGVQQKVDRKDLVSFLMGKNEIGASIETAGKMSIMFANNRYIVDHINCDTKDCSANLTEAIERVRHLFDVIIFDCPRALDNDLTNTVLYMCDTIYCVWDEGLQCISNIDRMRKNMQVSGIDFNKIKVVFNKKTNIYYTKYVFEQLSIEVVETIPFDTAVIESSLRGEIFCEKGASASKNAAAFVAAIDSLADKILENGGYSK